MSTFNISDVTPAGANVNAMMAATDIAVNAITANKATTGNAPEPASRARSIGKAFAAIDRLFVCAKFAQPRTATAG